jgi:DNA polymerase-3 subunit alpha
MENIPKYCQVKNGLSERDYLHPSVDHILDETQGIIVYQEQVMQIAQEMAGYSLGGADLLRRAMGKKIQEAMDAERPKFLKGAAENGVDEAKALEVWNLLDKFANYGFNKSHAAAYAVVSYQTAWLKANHPVEFMAAVMNCDMHLTEKLAVYKGEVDRMGIEVMAPCVNRSGARFEVSEGRILYALGALKNVGAEAMRLIVEARRTEGARNPSPRSTISRAAWTSSAWASDRWRCWPVPAPSTRSTATGTGCCDRSMRWWPIPPRSTSRRAARRCRSSARRGGPAGAAPARCRRLDARRAPGRGTPCARLLLLRPPARRLHVGAQAQGRAELRGGGGARRARRFRDMDGGRGVATAGTQEPAGHAFRLRGAVGPTGTYEVMVFSEALEAARHMLEPGTNVRVQVKVETQDGQVRLRAETVQLVDEAVAAEARGFPRLRQRLRRARLRRAASGADRGDGTPSPRGPVYICAMAPDFPRGRGRGRGAGGRGAAGLAADQGRAEKPAGRGDGGGGVRRGPKLQPPDPLYNPGPVLPSSP